MNFILAMLYLLLDGVLLTTCAIACYSLLPHSREDCLLRTVAGLGVVAMALLLLVINALGLVKALHPSGITGGLALLSAASALWRRKAMGAFLKDLKSRFVRYFSQTGWAEVCVFGLIALAAALLFYHNLYETPKTYDSMTYRLTRVGLYLQDHTISHYETLETRLNYSGRNADLLMLWVVGHFPKGYPLASMVQWFAGLQLLFATWGIAHLLKLSRTAKCIAVVLAFGSSCVVQQMMSTQTDLVVGALLALGIYFLMEDLMRQRVSPLPAIAIALSLGAKGTVFYYGPALVIIVVVGLFLHRLKLIQILQHAGMVAAAIMVFAAPGFIDNFRTYGHPLAPPEAFDVIHGNEFSGIEYKNPVEKTVLNCASLLLQTFSNADNPYGLGELTAAAGRVFLPWLPNDYRYLMYPSERRTLMEELLKQFPRDSDIAGIPLLLMAGWLFSGGAIIFHVIRHRERSLTWLLLLWLVPFVTLIFFSYTSNFTPFKQRYLIASIPLMAALSAWLFSRFHPNITRLLLLLIVLHQGILYHGSLFNNLRHGFGQGREAWNVHHRRMAVPSMFLEDYAPDGANIALAMIYNHPMAGFLRNGSRYPVKLYDAAVLEETITDLQGWMEAEEIDILVVTVSSPLELNSSLRGLQLSLEHDDFSGFAIMRPTEKISSAALSESPLGCVRYYLRELDSSHKRLTRSIKLEHYGTHSQAPLVLRNKGNNRAEVALSIGDADPSSYTLAAGEEIVIEIDITDDPLLTIFTYHENLPKVSTLQILLPGFDLPYLKDFLW